LSRGESTRAFIVVGGGWGGVGGGGVGGLGVGRDLRESRLIIRVRGERCNREIAGSRIRAKGESSTLLLQGPWRQKGTIERTEVSPSMKAKAPCELLNAEVKTGGTLVRRGRPGPSQFKEQAES